MSGHPCLSCALPDCDDASKSCGLRRAIALRDRKRRLQLPLSAAEREAYNAAWTELYGISRNARRSEQRAGARA